MGLRWRCAGNRTTTGKARRGCETASFRGTNRYLYRTNTPTPEQFQNATRAVSAIREEALKALATPAVRDRLMAVGLNVNTQNPPTPEQMAKSLQDDYESVGAMLKAVNYKPE